MKCWQLAGRVWRGRVKEVVRFATAVTGQMVATSCVFRRDASAPGSHLCLCRHLIRHQIQVGQEFFDRGHRGVFHSRCDFCR